MNRGRIIFLTLILILLLGCSANEEASVREAVENYNENLVMALKGLNPDLLKKVATDREQGAVQIFITQMADENKIVDSELVSLQIKNVTIKSKNSGGTSTIDKASVITEEIWTFRYLDINTRQPSKQAQKVKYAATYSLIKEGDKWLVDDIQFEEKLIK